MAMCNIILLLKPNHVTSRYENTHRINTVRVACYQPCPCHLIYRHLFPPYHLTILLTFSHLSTPFSFHHLHLHLWKFNTPFIYSTCHSTPTYFYSIKMYTPTHRWAYKGNKIPLFNISWHSKWETSSSQCLIRLSREIANRSHDFQKLPFL